MEGPNNLRGEKQFYKECISTLEDLLSSEVGAADLGVLSQETGAFHEMFYKMLEAAEKQGIKNPIMVTAFIKKGNIPGNIAPSIPGSVCRVDYDKWNLLAANTIYFEEIPRVYMIDGDKYDA